MVKRNVVSIHSVDAAVVVFFSFVHPGVSMSLGFIELAMDMHSGDR